MKSSASLKLSIAIPFYNEESILKKNLSQLATELSQFDEQIEVFLCDSGSVDNGRSIAQDFIR
ncbi:MAG: glycosyl transferase family 2, partial [Deltaproteobacteria bacterium CG11_big_fil_rev_8_21_14_0_20_45_16]